MSQFEEGVKRLLDLYPDLSDVFDVLDISPEEAITALLASGLVELPPFLQPYYFEGEDE